MSANDYFQIYIQTIGQAFRRVKKIGFKKYALIKQLVDVAENFLAKEVYGRIEPSHYLLVMIVILGSKAPKVYAPVISAIQRLFSYNFINPNEEIAGSLKLLKEEHRQFLLLPVDDYENKSFKEIYIQTMINLSDKDDGLSLNIAKSLSLIWRLDQNSIPISLLSKIFDYLIECMPLNKQEEEERMIKSVVLEMFRHSLESYKEVYDRKFLYQDNSVSLKSVCSKYTSIIADAVAIKLDVAVRYSVENYSIIPIEDSEQPFKLYMSKQVNQKGQISGKFGWCVFCRQTANYYCKLNRLAVCSFQCKHSIINQLQSIEKFISEEERSAEIFENHIIELFVLFKKYLSSNDPRKRISFAQIFVMMTSELKKIVDKLTPRMYKELRAVVRQVIINIYSESEAFLPCIATLKKLIHLRIFLDQTEILLRLFARKLTYFLTPSYVREQILRFTKDLINSKILFDCTMALDCSPEHYDAVRELIDAIRQVYIGVPFPDGITIPPPEDIQARRLSMEVLVTLLKALQERQKRMKESQEQQVKLEKDKLNTIRNNIETFNKSEKPLKIIKKLIESKFLQAEPAKIAKFIHLNLKRLNLTNIGTLIGDLDSFAGQIRKEFIGQINFQGDEIDGAMRVLLKQFTLPGESQVVQRIVQTFGIQYFNQSKAKGIFVNSDAVYSFSYLLMMLQSNLHNPQVVEKMTLLQFSKLSKGMNGAADAQFPADFLEMIYNSVQKKPLGVHQKLKQIEIMIAYNVNPRKAQQIYLKDLQREGSQNLSVLEQSGIIQLKQYQNYPWSIFIQQFFSQIVDIFTWRIRELQQKQKQELVKYIELIENCMRIASEQRISKIIERGIQKIWQQIQKANFNKKYLLMQAMLEWSKKFSEQIVEQWKTILYMISKFVRSKFIKKDSKNNAPLLVIDNKCFLLQSYIEQLITKTSKLSLKNVLGFLRALLHVSKDEIGDNGCAFSLEKINEVLELNTGRSLDILNAFWSELRQHYCELGKHKSEKIALFAADFLKQLATKFLKRKELINLQKDYLRPFQDIFMNTKLFLVKELIVGGIHYFVTNHSTSLKNGWKVILSILSNCFQEEQNPIIKEKAYGILKKISQKNFAMFNLSQNYNDFVQIVSKLAREKEESYGLGTLQIIKQIIEYYHGELGINLQASADDENNKKLDINFWQTIFLPLLSIIFPICGDSRTNVQSPAITCLFSILFKYGKLFKYQFWKMVLQGVLRPAFQQITYTSQSKPLKKTQLQTWLKHSFSELFKSINELIVLYYNDFRLFLEDVFKIYQNCILNHSLKLLIVLSLEALNDLLKQIAVHFQSHDWETYLTFAQSLLKKTLPTEISSLEVWNRSKDLLETNYQAKCFALYLFLSKSQQIYEKYPESITSNIYNDTLKELDYLFKFVSDFNQNIQLRESLWKNGFYPEVKVLPGLIKHHYEILRFKCKIYFALIKISQSYMDQYFKLVIQIFELANAFQLRQYLKDPSLRDFERERLKNNYKQLLQETIYNQLDLMGMPTIYQHNKNNILLEQSLKLLGNRIYCTRCAFCENCQNNNENNKMLNELIQGFILRLFKAK